MIKKIIKKATRIVAMLVVVVIILALGIIIAEPLIYKDHIVPFSFSIGIAIAKEANSPEDLIAQADQAMYKAKTLKHHWFIYHS